MSRVGAEKRKYGVKKKTLFFLLLYYPLSLLIYMGFFYGVSWLLRMSGTSHDLGIAIAVTYGVLFVGTPILMAVLMRFSLLPWVVDPFAAAEIPLFLTIGMVVNQMKHTEELSAAILLVNGKLTDDGGEGWIFLIGLFLFGLAASFSAARTKRESIAYRLLSESPPEDREI